MAERPGGQFVPAAKLLFLSPGTLQSARKETGLKQLEKKRNIPGIPKDFLTLGKNGNCEMLQPLAPL